MVALISGNSGGAARARSNLGLDPLLRGAGWGLGGVSLAEAGSCPPRRAATGGEGPRLPADRRAAGRLQDDAVRRERGRRRVSRNPAAAPPNPPRRLLRPNPPEPGASLGRATAPSRSHPGLKPPMAPVFSNNASAGAGRQARAQILGVPLSRSEPKAALFKQLGSCGAGCPPGREIASWPGWGRVFIGIWR